VLVVVFSRLSGLQTGANPEEYFPRHLPDG